MITPCTTRLQMPIVIGVALILLTGCGSRNWSQYQIESTQLDNREVHTSMRQMAVHVKTIDVLLDDPDVTVPDKNKKLIRELRQIRTITDSFISQAPISNHRIITDNIGNLRREIVVSIKALEESSPNYLPTRQLVQQCLSCHTKALRFEEAF